MVTMVMFILLSELRIPAIANKITHQPSLVMPNVAANENSHTPESGVQSHCACELKYSNKAALRRSILNALFDA
jgi:hypothetical protein